MTRTTLRRLEVFVGVVEAGGFRACSDLLDISPAAVSHQIGQLEEEMGYALFDRQRGRVSGLTPQGAKAYREAKELLGHAGAFECRHRCAPESEPRRLAVYADAILDAHLAKHIASFVSGSPAMDVALKRSYFEEIVDSFGRRQADIAYFYSAGPVNELASEFVWWEPICICARHDHPIFSQPQLSLRDLSAYPFVSPPRGCHFRRSVDALLRRHGLERYDTAIETGHANIAREAVIGGFAISAVIKRYLDDELIRCGVRAVPLAENGLALEVRRAVRRDLALDRAAMAFTHSLDKTAPEVRLS
jgi:DNA-binding transcriptional LysR family regulator